MLVPFPPGGGTDYIARLLGRDLSEMWGQTVLIENRPGASMMIASEIVAKAPPDGYTIIMSSSNHTINPSLYPKIPYDTVKDFAPVTQVATSPFVLVTHPSLPVRSVKELIALARARKGQLTYASSGTGGPQQLAGELFKMMAKVAVVRVEQLYPFPIDQIRTAISRYTNAKELVWLQEEPENMGPRYFVDDRIWSLKQEGYSLSHVARVESGSPATGSKTIHDQELADLMEQTFSN